MAQITVPVVIDHEYLDKAVKKAAEELKKQFIPKYVIKDAVNQIYQSDIPFGYVTEKEKDAYINGQENAISILKECIKEYKEDQEAADGPEQTEE